MEKIHPRKKKLLEFIKTLSEQKNIEYGFNLMGYGECLDSYCDYKLKNLASFSCRWSEVTDVELFSYNTEDDDPDAYTVIFKF